MRRSMIYIIAFLLALTMVVPVVTEEPQVLVLVPESEWCVTGAETSFTVVIPEVIPSEVQFSLEPLPDDIRFVSSHKDEVLIGRHRGTRISLWFSFSHEGTVQIPDLSIMTDGSFRTIAFEPVTVYPDPSQLMPELEISVASAEGTPYSVSSDGTVQLHTGDAVRIQLAVSYAAQITGLTWSLPEDALFSELTQYPTMDENFEANKFSPEPVPVADFQWIPLKSGQFPLPEIKIEAVAYNGSSVVIEPPPLFFQVEPSIAVSGEAPLPLSYWQAFVEQEPEPGPVPEDYGIDDSVAKLIAVSRMQERYGFPFSGIAGVRAEYEESAGVAGTGREHSVIILLIMCVAGVLCLVGAVFLVSMRKKKTAGILVAGAGIILGIAAVVYGIPLGNPAGISTGGIVRQVPESGSAGLFSISAGTRVSVLEQTGTWYYISAEGVSGWVPADSIIKFSWKNYRAYLKNTIGEDEDGFR